MRFQTNTDTCGQGIRNFGCDKIVRTYVHVSGCQESAPVDVKCQTSWSPRCIQSVFNLILDLHVIVN